MAFTSEAMLKFGSSTISFAIVTLLDYSLSNEMAGAFIYRRKEKIALQGLFSNRESNVPISEHFRQVKLLIENASDFSDLYINDKPYGKARFLSFSFPSSVGFDENSVRFSKINIELEIIKDDSTNAFASGNLPTDVGGLTSLWYKLKNFTESFSFRLAEDNNFSVSHDLSFGFDNIDKNTDIEVANYARQIANKFFSQGLDALSSIRSFYSSTDFQISAMDYGSSLIDQTIDLINYNFSYSKNYVVFSDNGSTTTETIVTDINCQENGVIEVIEKGRIKGKGSSYETARSNAIARLNVNLSNAYTRCNASFSRYLSTNYSRFAKVLPKYSTPGTLQSSPISITKDLSEFGPEIGYEIRFTTLASYTPTVIHSYSVNLRRTSQGIYEASVDGSIKYYTNKNKNFSTNISSIKSILDASDVSIISPYYKKTTGSASNYAGSKTNTSINYLKFGVETTYSKSYSDSPTILASGNLIRQTTISENINVPVNRYSTVNIPGGYNAMGKEIIYQTRQYTEGSKSISIDMKVDRNVLYNGLGSAVNLDSTKVFPKLKTLLVDKMINNPAKTSAGNGYLFFGSLAPGVSSFAKIYNELQSFKKEDLTYFLEDLKLSVDSSYNIKANLVYKFLINKEIQ